MTKLELDTLAKSMGITTALTGPQRISLAQVVAVDRLAAAMEALVKQNAEDGPRIDRTLDLTAQALKAA